MCLYVIDLHFVDAAVNDKALDICTTPIHFVLSSVLQVTGGIRKPKLLQCIRKSLYQCSSVTLHHIGTRMCECFKILHILTNVLK